MISLLLNDKYILLLQGVIDNGLYVIDKFLNIDTGVSLKELIDEPANQVKVEKILENNIKQNGMTTDEVVILLPDSIVNYKPILVDRNLQVNEINRLIPIELEATFGDSFQPDKEAVYHLNNIGMRDIYLNDIALTVPIRAVQYTEKLIKFLGADNFSVSSENVGLLNFFSNNHKKPKNFVILNFIFNGLVEVLIFRQNKFYSIFKLVCGSDLTNSVEVAANLGFINSTLSYQFPDDMFEGIITSARPDLPDSLQNVLAELNIGILDPIEFLSNVQSMEEQNQDVFLPYLSLFGTLV